MNLALFTIVVLATVTGASPLNRCVLVAVPLSSGNDGYSISANISTASHQDNLELIIFDSELKYESMILFLSHKVSGYHFYGLEHLTGNQCSDILGVVGDLDFTTTSIIHNMAARSNSSVTQVISILSTNILPLEDLAYSNVVDMNPLSHYIDAITSLIDRLDWTYIGLITDSTNYQLYAAELLLKKLHSIPEMTVSPYVRLGLSNEDYIRALQQVEIYRTKVIIIMASEEVTCTTLEYALQHNFIWPEYVWIVYNIQSSECSIAMEGVILLNKEQINIIDLKSQLWINEVLDINISSIFSGHTKLNKSRYLSLLYDSILTVALAEQLNFTNASFPGISGQVQIREGKRLSNISIIHIQNYTDYEIGYYDTASKELHTLEDNNPFKVVTIPRDSVLTVHDGITDLDVIFVLNIFAVCVGIVTVTLILYVYFHKEPEVKATSVTLSMCMFLGCYISLLFVPLLLINQPEFALLDIICMWLAWFSVLGLPFPLILGTLLLKMLRVYVIFFHPHSYKKKLCSDGALFMFVLLLSSPTILVFTAWTVLDYYSKHTIVIPQKGYLEIHNVCSGNHVAIWLGLLILNFFIFLIVVIVVAFKTSKIRYKHFRDAKATNIYAFLVSFLTVMTVLYWLFFRSLEVSVPNLRSAAYTLYVGHISIPMSCQFTLFIPKLYPPIVRRLKQWSSNRKSNNS